MRGLLILDAAFRILYPAILVLSVFFLFAGHNQPGGGFVGGLAAGAGISLRYVQGGLESVRRSFPLRPSTVLGGGLVLALSIAVVPLFTGNNVLEHATFSADLPLLHEVKVTSALPFDLGVYFVVVGLVLAAFEAFGEDLGRELDRVEEPKRAASGALDEYRRTRRRPGAAGGERS